MRKRLALAVTLTLLAIGGATPATATAETETHCVVQVIDETAGGELITSEPECFATFAQAAFVVTGGSLAGRDDLRGTDAFTDARTMATLASFTLGIHFDGYGGTGSSISVAGSSCTGGYWNTPSSWDNRISSSYNGCYRLRHFDFPATGGSQESTTGAGTTDNLGSMNNRTESVSYHSS